MVVQFLWILWAHLIHEPTSSRNIALTIILAIALCYFQQLDYGDKLFNNYQVNYGRKNISQAQSIFYLKTRYGTKRCSTFPIKNLVCHLQLPASRDRCLYLSNLPGNSNTQKLEAIFEMEADCNLEEVCLMKVGCTELSALVNVTFPEREFFGFRIHFDTL